MRAQKRQSLRKHFHDLHAKDRQFQVNDPVLAKNFSTGSPWITGKVLMQSGAATFLVGLPDGRVIRCHPNQSKSNMLDLEETLQPDNVDKQWIPSPFTVSTQPDAPFPQETSSSEPIRHSSHNKHPPYQDTR